MSEHELSASLEDYLETIYHLIAEKRVARSKDIAKGMGVSTSSVTGALHALAERGLVNYAPYEVVTLTEPGEEAAGEVVARHQALRDFFVDVLAVDPSDAEEAACKMEHAISRGVFERLIQFARFVEECPLGGAQWVACFSRYCQEDGQRGDCAACLERSSEAVAQRTKETS